ncbi:MAG TPA: threonine synthase [Xanthomonadales bacterium]|nr:threonine synthase [Xanthomonadales bacterium]
MRYLSTRQQSPALSLSQALARGLAPDGGLYVPERLPQFDPSDFDGRTHLAEIAETLLAPFCADDPLADALSDLCRRALDPPLALTTLPGDQDDHLLELFHGPSAAFKDFAARFLAECLAHGRAPDTPELTILVATSGDTGAAVAAAFHRRPGFRVVILYPEGRVSPRQAHMLGALGDNVSCLRVAGRFDDCQALAKQALADADLRQRRPLSSANSISLGRLLPQMAYYAWAALHFQRQRGEPLNFAIPTGNLGNALAAVLARTLGLPIGEIVLACNDNRSLTEFFAGNAYRPRPSVATLANAMDVGDPSNFERLRWLIPDPEHLRRALRAVSVDDPAIRRRLAVVAERGAIVCPHTATALDVIADLRASGDRRPWAAVATAHPAKFEQVLRAAIGHAPEPPAALQAWLARPDASEPIACHYPTLAERLARP